MEHRDQNMRADLDREEQVVNRRKTVNPMDIKLIVTHKVI